MSELKKRHPVRSDEEWISLIRECRTSGMTDKAWCISRNIQTSKFYYHIRRLRAKACALPDNPRVLARSEHHEVVKVELNDPALRDQTPGEPFSVPDTARPSITGSGHTVPESSLRSGSCAMPAIHLSVGRVGMDIYNSADRSIILTTLSVLQSLC